MNLSQPPFSSAPFTSSSSALSWPVNGASASWDALLSPSHRTAALFWLERSRWRGCVFWSPGLKDCETPEPALANPNPQPWRDPSLRRPPEPARVAGAPGRETSGSVWDADFLRGEGETGALRGSGTVWKGFINYYKGNLKQNISSLLQLIILSFNHSFRNIHVQDPLHLCLARWAHLQHKDRRYIFSFPVPKQFQGLRTNIGSRKKRKDNCGSGGWPVLPLMARLLVWFFPSSCLSVLEPHIKPVQSAALPAINPWVWDRQVMWTSLVWYSRKAEKNQFLTLHFKHLFSNYQATMLHV